MSQSGGPSLRLVGAANLPPLRSKAKNRTDAARRAVAEQVQRLRNRVAVAEPDELAAIGKALAQLDGSKR